MGKIANLKTGGFTSRGNVSYKRAVNISERRIFPATRPLHLQSLILPQQAMTTPFKEARMLLVLKSIQNSKKPNILSTTKSYDVPETTLHYRRAGRPSRRDIPANSRKLTDLEESSIVQYISELCTRAFPASQPPPTQSAQEPKKAMGPCKCPLSRFLSQCFSASWA